MSYKGKTVAPPDNPLYHLSEPGLQFDVATAFKQANPSMCDNYGMDPWSYNGEHNHHWISHYYRNESKMAHGYPMTYFLQAGIIYGLAFYTAREQGLPKPHMFFKSHWFDWMLFFKRSAIFGVAGGMVLGTLLFGDTRISLNRIGNYFYKMKYTDLSFGDYRDANVFMRPS